MTDADTIYRKDQEISQKATTAGLAKGRQHREGCVRT